MFAIQTSANAFVTTKEGTVRTWEKKSTAQKYRSANKIDGQVVEYQTDLVMSGSDSSFLRAAAARFAKNKDAYKAYLEEAVASGVTRSLARRQFRKVHGAVYR